MVRPRSGEYPTDTVTNRRRPAIYAAPTPVPYPTSICHDDQRINKVQGQKLQRSGVLLDETVFTHGRRVVALWGSQQHQIFFVQNGQTANVVYTEVLSC